MSYRRPLAALWRQHLVRPSRQLVPQLRLANAARLSCQKQVAISRGPSSHRHYGSSAQEAVSVETEQEDVELESKSNETPVQDAVTSEETTTATANTTTTIANSTEAITPDTTTLAEVTTETKEVISTDVQEPVHERAVAATTATETTDDVAAAPPVAREKYPLHFSGRLYIAPNGITSDLRGRMFWAARGAITAVVKLGKPTLIYCESYNNRTSNFGGLMSAITKDLILLKYHEKMTERTYVLPGNQPTYTGTKMVTPLTKDSIEEFVEQLRYGNAGDYALAAEEAVKHLEEGTLDSVAIEPPAHFLEETEARVKREARLREERIANGVAFRKAHQEAALKAKAEKQARQAELLAAEAKRKEEIKEIARLVSTMIGETLSESVAKKTVEMLRQSIQDVGDVLPTKKPAPPNELAPPKVPEPQQKNKDKTKPSQPTPVAASAAAAESQLPTAKKNKKQKTKKSKEGAANAGASGGIEDNQDDLDPAELEEVMSEKKQPPKIQKSNKSAVSEDLEEAEDFEFDGPISNKAAMLSKGKKEAAVIVDVGDIEEEDYELSLSSKSQKKNWKKNVGKKNKIVDEDFDDEEEYDLDSAEEIDLDSVDFSPEELEFMSELDDDDDEMPSRKSKAKSKKASKQPIKKSGRLRR